MATSSEKMTLLPPDYTPGDDEEYMNQRQLLYFEKMLSDMKADILRQAEETLKNIQEETMAQPDANDRASLETDVSIELRTRDRQRKLIGKIDEALMRIHDGSYGYCEDTGKPIGLKRLIARPTATLCIEAQEQHERHEKTHRDDDERYG